MGNLSRALRIALKYRWSLLTSIVCSALVAVLWSANLGAVYPFVEVVLRNKSLHSWADDQIENSREIIAKNQDEISGIERIGTDGPEVDINRLERKKRALTAEIGVHEKRIERTEWARPFIQRFTPDDPFQTLVLLIVFMFLGTVFRGLFLVGNMVAVARIGQRTILDIQNMVFANVLETEVSELDVKGTGDLMGRIRGETNAIGNAITTLFGKTVREPMKMVACIAGAAVVNWRLLLFSMLICPLAGYLMVWLARMTKRANKRAAEEVARLMNRLYQSVTYLRIVKAFTLEKQERGLFRRISPYITFDV